MLLWEFYECFDQIYPTPNTFLIHPIPLPTQVDVLSFLVIQDQFSAA